VVSKNTIIIVEDDALQDLLLILEFKVVLLCDIGEPPFLRDDGFLIARKLLLGTVKGLHVHRNADVGELVITASEYVKHTRTSQ
jgi:hypothetical protein